MSLVSLLFRYFSAKDENKVLQRQAPPDLTLRTDISYTGRNEKYERLDVYWPKNARCPLPVILNVHGGGWVYGNKEVYRPYCLTLARQGFAVVNMNYHLAPKRRFPTQLGQINQVLGWVLQNAGNYPFDTNNIFLVGDSAGGQMVAQYAAIWSNPAYAALFPFTCPKGLSLRAVGLSCGTYTIAPVPKTERKKFTLPKNIRQGHDLLQQNPELFTGMMAALMDDYLGKNAAEDPALPAMLDVKGHITGKFPPAFLMTCQYDFLRDAQQPMCDLLQSRGVEAVCRCYGTEADKEMTHVCNTRVTVPQSAQMNRDQLAFFRRHIQPAAGGKNAPA